MARVAPGGGLPSSSSSSNNRWAVPAENLAGGETAAKFKKLSSAQKAKRFFGVVLKLFLLFAIIFVFICSLGLLTDAFKLIAVKGFGETIKNSSLVQNPVSASILGMMSTLILQNGSTLVSILVGMVASGLLTVHNAIFFLFGSEMGASLTNALISLAQSGDRDMFRRSFAAATMNDAFNILNYLTLLPMEMAFGMVEKLSGIMVQPLVGANVGELKTLNLLTDPLLDDIVHIDDDAINLAIAASGGNGSIPSGRDTFIYRCVDMDTHEIDPNCTYGHFFAYSVWPDPIIGAILLAVAISTLICCLIGIVQTMQSLLAGRVAVLVRRLLDQECPSPFQCFTGYVVMFVGCLVVIVVQSNSVFRSTLTPLVGIGVVTLDRLYPLLLGANIGTSFTGILAALSADPIKLRETLQIALCETICNICGVLFFYPIPFLRRIPMTVAMGLGDLTATYRWFSLVYIAVFFFAMPTTLLTLSLLPGYIALSILGSILMFVTTMVIINWIQETHPTMLPKKFRSWEFLPIWLRSLKPYDTLITKYFSVFACCQSHFLSPVEEPSNTADFHDTITMDQIDSEKAENRVDLIREIVRSPPSHIDMRALR